MKQTISVFLLVLACVVGFSASGSAQIQSDDFHLPTLNTSIWTFVDSVGDATLSFVGTNTRNARLSLAIPGGVDHDPYNGINDIPRIMQAAPNSDFVIQAKFDSPVGPSIQILGLIVEASPTEFLRFDFYSNGGQTWMYSALGGPTGGAHNIPIAAADTTPLYMRVSRVVDQWTQSYSFDGTTWVDAPAYTYAMTVTKVGVYCANASGSSSPAHTALVDYFQNNASPIVEEDPIPFGVYDAEAIPTSESATFRWTTPLSATSRVDYGTTAAYGNSLVDTTRVKSHFLNITGLAPLTSYHFKLTSVDSASNSVSSTDTTFTTGASTTLVSDEFNSGSLSGVWQFVNPSGDSSAQSLTGTQLSLRVIGGTRHDLWTDNRDAIRLVQNCNNADFEVTVKYDAGMNQGYQIQGLIAQQDSHNLVRFDFNCDGTHTKFFAATITNDTGTSQLFPIDIGSTNLSPTYIRATRQGAFWKAEYSFDATTWTTGVTFYHVLTVSAVGVTAGNSAPNYPALTSLVDWFSKSGILPVQLASFTASFTGENHVRLDWTTLSETNNFGFYVQKSDAQLNHFVTIENSFIPGNGTTITPHSYTFTHALTPGRWLYRLLQVDLDGTQHYSEPIQVNTVTGTDEGGSVPKEFSLKQNYPNPFNPTTMIQFELPKESRIRLEVFNIIGQKVATMFEGVKPAGYHDILFDASHLTSGIYIYKLTVPNQTFAKKMVLTK